MNSRRPVWRLRIRSVSQEYEADLGAPTTGRFPAARGKAEWKVYADGARRGRVSISKLDLPDGAALELTVEHRRIADLTVERRSARYRRETEWGDDVPWVDDDQLLQVIHAGQVLLEGRFRAE